MNVERGLEMKQAAEQHGSYKCGTSPPVPRPLYLPFFPTLTLVIWPRLSAECMLETSLLMQSAYKCGRRVWVSVDIQHRAPIPARAERG